MELANLLFIQAKKPGSYLFGLGSKEVLGVFLAEGRFQSLQAECYPGHFMTRGSDCEVALKKLPRPKINVF